ncbi:hypothetical protein HWV62_38454 [Athelia sp. TMB]|nr:hypothetical protein HWV62_38454 [Athelia sp. TMB]
MITESTLLQQTNTDSLFAGHLGRLSSEQQESFTKFKVNLATAGLYTPETDTSRASHDEPTLLRFLRARRFDPAKAQKQFADTKKWREQHNVDNLYANFDNDEFEACKKYYPRWTGRRDKQGLPLYVYRLASLVGPVQKELDSIAPDRRYQRIVALHETMVGLVMPLCSYLPHASAPTPVSQVTTLIDLDGVSFSAMWSLRGHLQQASTLATANYPETLSTIAVVNSPSFFPTVWGWIKGWFDEGTRNKIHVLGKDPGPTLRHLVDPQDLPKAYGGKLEWVYEDEPSLDAAAKEVIGEMPRGPAFFVDGAIVSPQKNAETKGPELVT